MKDDTLIATLDLAWTLREQLALARLEMVHARDALASVRMQSRDASAYRYHERLGVAMRLSS
ncbi:hypothetical protein X750_05175 [Mesorhizobium sp. LNJC394B00]|nr:hypothetical protein X750_05175 [Mesorhizobium sp. LNJC394B00]